jgi:pyruvate-formate lyase
MTCSRTRGLREMVLDVSHNKFRVRRDLSVLGKGYDDQPVIIRKARAFEYVLDQMPVFIQKGELIVGGRTMFLALEGQFAASGKKNLDFVPDAETLAKRSPGFEFFPHYATEIEKKAGQPYQIGEGYVTSHCVAGYGNILRSGFGGIRSRAESMLAKGNITIEMCQFLEAVVICMNAASSHLKRYEKEALRLADLEKEPSGQAELWEIANICRRITTEPARSFYEALQLLFFSHTFTLIENYNLMALGRMDQYLYEFYSSDITNKTITKQKAIELLECLFIKFNDTSDLHTDNGQNIMLSGLRPDGSDGTNELTYLLLDVHAGSRLTDPQVNIRLHRNSPPELLFKAFYGDTAGPKPMVYNDDSVIPALTAVGVNEQDARDYCIDACQDILIAEKSDFYPIFAGVYGCHLITVLERVMGAFDKYTTFKQFWDAFLHELSKNVRDHVERANETDRLLPKLSPTPFLSSTLEGCIEVAKDKTEGGTKYNFTGFIGGGIVNVANSIAALKNVVYEKHTFTNEQIIRAIDSDFDDTGEEIRNKLMDAPKWGNNEAYVDDIASNIAEVFCDEVLKYKNPRGGRFVPGLFTHHQARLGMKLKSGADGRRRGEPLAVSLSPSNGSAHRGPTGEILSAAKINQFKCPLGTSLDLSFQPSLFAEPDSMVKLEALIRTYFEKGGIELQINCFDADVLKEAQRAPERHRDLIVRVWGFNAYFVTLKREYQDELIRRFEGY